MIGESSPTASAAAAFKAADVDPVAVVFCLATERGIRPETIASYSWDMISLWMEERERRRLERDAMLRKVASNAESEKKSVLFRYVVLLE